MVQLRAPKTIRNSHSKENPKNPSEQDKTNLKLNKDLNKEKIITSRTQGKTNTPNANAKSLKRPSPLISGAIKQCINAKIK